MYISGVYLWVCMGLASASDCNLQRYISNASTVPRRPSGALDTALQLPRTYGRRSNLPSIAHTQPDKNHTQFYFDAIRNARTRIKKRQ